MLSRKGWRDNVKRIDATVDRLIADPKMEKLRRYRNAVFHYQPEYFSPKMLEAMQEPNFVPWVTLLHKELGRFFLEYIDKLKAKPAS